jgi:hypothetical protein
MITEHRDPVASPPGGGLDRVDLVALSASGAISAPLPTLLSRSDGRKLFYPGAINWLAGEPGSGKTFLALAAAVEVLRDGERVAFIDYEDTPHTFVHRLACLGLEDDALARVEYLRATGALDDANLAWLVDLIDSHGIALVVIDSVPESLASEGANENSATEVASWVARVPRRWARAGAAVVVIDHVVKNVDGRGRWARGSGHKLAAVDGVAYMLATTIPFSRERSGSARLIMSKDRHGMVGAVGQTAADINFVVEAGSIRRIDVIAPRVNLDMGNQTGRVTVDEVVAACRSCGGQFRSVEAASRELGVSRNVASARLEEAVYAGLMIEQHDRGRRVFRIVEETDWDELLHIAARSTEERALPEEQS